MTPIFYIKEGNLCFADKVILEDIELYLYPADKICLIGRNGSGKSSLMKVIIGDYELDSGEVFRDNNLSVGYLSQDVKPGLSESVYEFILHQFIKPAESKYLADIILEKLQLNGNLKLSECSGGQLRRAYLAKVLVAQPEILLLDEPTNHLDITTIEWLEEFVKSYKGAIICISHDRSFLANVTNKIWWLDRGCLRKSDKGFKYFDEWQEQIITQEEATLRKLNKKLDEEKLWLSQGVTARRKRNQKRLVGLRSLREQLRNHTNKLKSAKQKIQMELADEAKKTKFIIEADNISFSYNNKKIINNFTFKVKKGEKIGLIGANGSGKSTLIKLLTKQVEPEAGRIKHGTNLEISYFDQYRSELNANHTIKQTLCPSGGDQIFLPGRTMHVAAYLKNFMFDPRILNDKVSTLSGGEASRLLLAKTLINPGNLLILDEPTNDLDMDSLEILLDILADYTGTLIVVSHDRDFLDRLVTRTLVFNPPEISDLVGGSYEDYKQLMQAKIEITVPKEKKSTIDGRTKIEKEQPKKLSYKHQRRLELIPDEIVQAEHKIKLLEEKLHDHNLYLSNPLLFEQVTREMENLKNKLDELIEEWESIEAILK